VDKKNQLDVTFYILYFPSNSCSTCFGQPCAHHQELTTAWCYSLVLVCAVAAGRWSNPVGRYQVVLSLFNYQDDAWSHKKQKCLCWFTLRSCIAMHGTKNTNNATYPLPDVHIPSKFPSSKQNLESPVGLASPKYFVFQNLQFFWHSSLWIFQLRPVIFLKTFLSKMAIFIL